MKCFWNGTNQATQYIILKLRYYMKYSNWNRFGFKWNSGRQIRTFLNNFMLESCFLQMKNHILSFEVVTSKVSTVKMFMAMFMLELSLVYFLKDIFENYLKPNHGKWFYFILKLLKILHLRENLIYIGIWNGYRDFNWVGCERLLTLCFPTSNHKLD